MQGNRLPDVEWPHEVEHILEPGDYAKVRNGKLWCFRAPNGDRGCIDPKIHTITEHEDGTITVSPSILCKIDKKWHGYLEKGVWRTS